jgi:uncharacterized membrane protein YphA (DoxX/SURF4 family)
MPPARLAFLEPVDRFTGLFLRAPATAVAARIVLCLPFWRSGLGKLLDFSGGTAGAQYVPRASGDHRRVRARGHPRRRRCSRPWLKRMENQFFEHLGLIGGFLLVAWLDVRQAKRDIPGQ